jgi:hypothetical protein
MALTIERMKKVGGVMTLADYSPATFNLSKLIKISKVNEVTVGVPGDLHVGVPIGPEAKEYQLEFPWNMAVAPGGNHSYTDSLKNWTCNSIYRLTPTDATADDICTYSGTPSYYIPRNITTTRDKVGLAGGSLDTGGYGRWVVSMNVIKLRDEDVTDCPDFEDVMPATTNLGANFVPKFTMTELRYGNSITTKLTKVVVKHTGSPQSFALYDEEAIAILPPLGSIGPVIDIDFRISSNTDFQLIKMWGATRSLIVGVDQDCYPEFDIDDPGNSFYSKWIGSNINVSRPIGSRVSAGTTYREVSMSLTRYWTYNIIEVV